MLGSLSNATKPRKKVAPLLLDSLTAYMSRVPQT